MLYKLNTSNLGKFQEYQELFAKHGMQLQATHIDLREIAADPLTVVTHKASQMEPYVLVDDTVMDIEGADVGVNIKWFKDHMSEFIGRRASWIVLLAYRNENNVYIFKGQIEGTIVPERGVGGFGFDPIFLPLGSNQTLAEYKPDDLSARALAVKALKNNKTFAVRPVMTSWNGPWQQS